MRTNWFVVICALDAWWIDNEGTSFGPFTSREAACSASSRIAQMFADASRRTQIFWPDEAGKPKMMLDGV